MVSKKLIGASSGFQFSIEFGGFVGIDQQAPAEKHSEVLKERAVQEVKSARDKPVQHQVVSSQQISRLGPNSFAPWPCPQAEMVHECLDRWEIDNLAEVEESKTHPLIWNLWTVWSSKMLRHFAFL